MGPVDARPGATRAVACTIAARNYLAHVRVLADGWIRHHADVPLHVLVLDEADGAPAVPGVTMMSPGELPLSAQELARMRGIYHVAEICTALKPHLMSALLGAGAEVVVFIDADCDVHASVEEVIHAAAREGVVLTPHFLRPPPLDGRSPGELEQGANGVFNSGFLAVGRTGLPFLEWWTARLRRDCIFNWALGLHADQRWLDWVPAFFEHHVLRDPGVNVAQWNVHERPIRRVSGAYTAGTGPLRVFHFAGFDPSDPMSPSTYPWLGGLRFDIAAEPDLARLCRDYGARLEAAGHAELRPTPYRYGWSAAGRELGRWERFAYRELVLAAEGRGADIPDPFDATRSVEFERMLDDPVATGLLSPWAAARVRDAKLVGPYRIGDRLDPARIAVGVVRQLARRVPGRRIPWRPNPLPSDRTLLEYAS